MPSDPLNLEPKNGDFVDYIESLQASSQKNLDGITPPMTADHHIGLPPNLPDEPMTASVSKI
ncbi:MAG: hypothetical protein ACLT49_08005 [Sutterella wadsworthensis]